MYGVDNFRNPCRCGYCPGRKCFSRSLSELRQYMQRLSREGMNQRGFGYRWYPKPFSRDNLSVVIGSHFSAVNARACGDISDFLWIIGKDGRRTWDIVPIPSGEMSNHNQYSSSIVLSN